MEGGSAATALLCAAVSLQAMSGPFYGINYVLFLLGYVSSLATKLADTFASEIGKAYGKTTFERVAPGTEGAVSLEGTLAAAVGGGRCCLCLARELGCLVVGQVWVFDPFLLFPENAMVEMQLFGRTLSTKTLNITRHAQYQARLRCIFYH